MVEVPLSIWETIQYPVILDSLVNRQFRIIGVCDVQ